MLLWFFILLFVGILIWGYVTRNNEAQVRLSIATFGCDIIVHDLQLGYKSFSVLVDFIGDDSIRIFGNTIGEIQFNISKECKQMAQEKGTFKEYIMDYDQFEVGVEKDGKPLSNIQYINLTTKEMRSTKNPIIGYRHNKGQEPLWVDFDTPIRAKL